eukprot:1956-Heterococcus_DN1.PRE.1
MAEGENTYCCHSDSYKHVHVKLVIAIDVKCVRNSPVDLSCFFELFFVHITHTASSNLSSSSTNMDSISTRLRRTLQQATLCLLLKIHCAFDTITLVHHAFIAPVCKLWKQSYEANRSLRVTGFDAIRKQISFLCDSTTTLCSSIFTSASRVDMAKALQRKLPGILVWGLACGAGKFAELSVLQYALSINLVDFYCPDQQQLLVKGSALAGNLIKLQWLYTEAWCELSTEVCESAARCGSTEMLEWLATVCDDNIVHTIQVMTAACVSGQIQTVQHLFAKGCAYSAYLCCNADAEGGRLDLIKWMMIDEPFSSDMHIDHATMM